MSFAPEGMEVVDDLCERVQPGDQVYDEDDEEWYPAARRQVGEFVSKFPWVARPLPEPKPRRLKRSRLRRPSH